MKKLVALAMSALMAISLSGAAFAAETEGDVVIPEDFKGSMPTIEEIEAELSDNEEGRV